MHYNVFYFFPATQKPVKLLVISQQELDRFLLAYRKGDTTVFIQNELMDMHNINGVHIFDCSKSSMPFTEGPFRFNMQLWIFLDEKKQAQELTKYFLKQGNNVTNNFIKGNWGYEKHLYPAPPVTSAPEPPAADKQQQKQVAPQPQYQQQEQTSPQQQSKQQQHQPTPAAPPKKNNSIHTSKRIFISHSSKDSDLVNAFCDLILDNALGIDTKNQLFNTSLDGSKPLSGEDFRDRIKDELMNADVVLQFITQNYKDSGVCMNEMGAAWVLNTQVIPLILEPGAYDVGFINSTIQQVKLWDADALFEFVDNHKGNFFPAEVTISRLNKKIKAFVGVVGEVYKAK